MLIFNFVLKPIKNCNQLSDVGLYRNGESLKKRERSTCERCVCVCLSRAPTKWSYSMHTYTCVRDAAIEIVHIHNFSILNAYYFVLVCAVGWMLAADWMGKIWSQMCERARAHSETVLLEIEIGIKTIIMFVYILCLLFGDSLKASGVCVGWRQSAIHCKCEYVCSHRNLFNFPQ